MYNILFGIICITHVLIWVFILTAFLNKKLAIINILIVIPMVYFLHILPFHVINEVKINVNEKQNSTENWETRVKKIDEILIIPHYWVKLSDYLDIYSFANPISPQGMLILGYILSIYSLVFYYKCIKF